MISEGSCDTEDWRNDCSKFSFDHMNKLHLKYIQIINSYLNCSNISQYYSFTVFQISDFITVFTLFLFCISETYFKNKQISNPNL